MVAGIMATVPTLSDIRAAAERIRSGIYRSPLHHSAQLSRLCGCEIYCKLDHLQITGSFKERGALNKLMLLTPAERAAGAICASAGNHALAVAYHGARLGVPVTVVMPRFAPLVKVTNCRGYGAEVVFAGETFVDAYDHATRVSAETGRTFIPGFDDEAVVAGAGTAGLELVQDLPDVDVVFVPVGGAGLLAGVGLVIRELCPKAKIIGVEPDHCPSLKRSLEAGTVLRVASSPTLADGLAVAQVGRIPFDLIKSRGLVDRIDLVSEGEIALGVLRLMELEKIVVEGAGAAPLSAAMLRRDELLGKKVALLLCGGNIDLTVISRIIDRALAQDGRLCRVSVPTSDRPGSLARMTALFARLGASVLEIQHDRHFGPTDPALVTITALLETRDRAHIAEIASALQADGLVVTLG